MARPARISWSWHDNGERGLKLVITHHDHGQGPVYRAEIGGQQLAWTGSEEKAKADAEGWLKDQVHTCTQRCIAWEAIQQPEPLSEGKKRDVVACFLTLKKAITTGVSHEHQLRALQHEYRGDARALVDGFDRATDKHRALQQLESELREEIEGVYWQQSS